MKKKNATELIKNTILSMTDSDTLEQAIEYFEPLRRQEEKTPRTGELFDSMWKAQVATLFKLLIDLEEVVCEDNVIKMKPSQKTGGKDDK